MIITSNINCNCQAASFDKDESLLQAFTNIRNKCSAIREVFVPDYIWQDYQKTLTEDFDEAKHHHILLGALENGYLTKLTFPVHRYILNGEKPKSTYQSKYFVENWMVIRKNHLERHKESRRFLGKLAELLIVAFIEDRGWRIDKIAALGGPADIVATAPKGVLCALEIKYIGQENNRYEEFVGSRPPGHVGNFDGYNLFLFDVYNAAKQLSQFNKKRIAIIVVWPDSWPLTVPIEDDYTSKGPISFSESASPVWKCFLADKKEKKPIRYGNIENDLDSTIKGLSEIWIIKEDNDMNYSLKKTIKLK